MNSFSYPILWCLCLPLAIPSLFLAFKLMRRSYLNTLLNKAIAVKFLITGTKTSLIHLSLRNTSHKIKSQCKDGIDPDD